MSSIFKEQEGYSATPATPATALQPLHPLQQRWKERKNIKAVSSQIT